MATHDWFVCVSVVQPLKMMVPFPNPTKVISFNQFWKKKHIQLKINIHLHSTNQPLIVIQSILSNQHGGYNQVKEIHLMVNHFGSYFGLFSWFALIMNWFSLFFTVFMIQSDEYLCLTELFFCKFSWSQFSIIKTHFTFKRIQLLSYSWKNHRSNQFCMEWDRWHHQMRCVQAFASWGWKMMSW